MLASTRKTSVAPCADIEYAKRRIVSAFCTSSYTTPPLSSKRGGRVAARLLSTRSPFVHAETHSRSAPIAIATCAMR
jgi:hypothetical protein